MASKQKIPDKLKIWIDARKQFHLSHEQIQMARELGMNPKKFGKLANHKQEPWKAPLPDFIESLYYKRFGKEHLDQVKSIERIVKDRNKKREERKQRKKLKIKAKPKSKWQTDELSTAFLEGVRGAIPGADLQLAVMGKIVQLWCDTPKHILDLGCGNGILGRFLLNIFPAAHGVFVDFSEPMLDAARKNLSDLSRTNILKADFSLPQWIDVVKSYQPFDIVVSGFAIHHQPDERKKALYSEIFNLLAIGGIFLNLDHVTSNTAAVGKLFDEFFVDHLYDFHARSDPAANRQEITNTYYKRPDKKENILAPVDEQCRWLRGLGYRDVDCFFKIFELALFGGRKTEKRKGRRNPMKIRRAAQSDFQNIAGIHAESWKDSYSDDLPAEFLAEQIDRILMRYWSEIEIQSGDIVLVAEEDSLVGFAAIWCRPIPFIDNLHVKPSYRSKGVGSSLMKSAAKELINTGHQTAYLWVFERNKKAIRFYERLGGVQKEQALKSVFGYMVLSRKIEWDDLSVICDDQ